VTTASSPPLCERAAEERADLAPLFADLVWPRSMIDAVLEGCVGTVTAGAGDAPGVAALHAQVFHLLGGDPSLPAAADLVQSLPAGQLVVGSAAWYALVKERRERAPESWYWRTYDHTRLDASELKRLAGGAHAAYEILPLDAGLLSRVSQNRDQTETEHAFRSDAELLESGFGYCAVQEDRVRSVAVTFTRSSSAVEAQINTHQEHRRRGLATATCASLVLRALEEGLEPHWSAANRRSEGLAEKLGFVPESRREVLYLPR